jgi:hypothetical protein
MEVEKAMTQTISRMYEFPEQAAQAKAALKRADYPNVHLVSAAGMSDAPFDDIVAAIARGNVLIADARIYAAGIAKGGSLVTVHTQFGSAIDAIRILDRFEPIDSGIPEPESHASLWNEATPISSILRLPVLINEAAPYSTFWNMPALADPSFSLSKLFGLPLLKNFGARSTSFGLPLLKPFGPRSTSFGLPLLSDQPAPLSSLLGLPTLTKPKPTLAES